MCRNLILTLILQFSCLAQDDLLISNTMLDNNGLVARWTFNEISGTNALDISGNANTASAISLVSWVPGLFGNALQMDVTNYMQTLSTVTFALGTSNTISCWSQQKDSQPSMLLGLNGSANNFIFFVPGSDLWVRDNAGQENNFTSAKSFTNWASYCLVFKTSTNTVISLYVDGVYLQSLTNSSSSFRWSLIGAGYNPPTYSPMKGIVEDLRMYNRALSDVEISQIFFQGGGRTP